MSRLTFYKVQSGDEEQAKQNIAQILNNLGKPTETIELPKHWNGVGSWSGSLRGDKSLGMKDRLEIRGNNIGPESTDIEKLTLKDALISACRFLLLPQHSKHLVDGFNGHIMKYYNLYMDNQPSMVSKVAAAAGFIGSNEDESSSCCSWLAGLFGGGQSKEGTEREPLNSRRSDFS